MPVLRQRHARADAVRRLRAHDEAAGSIQGARGPDLRAMRTAGHSRDLRDLPPLSPGGATCSPGPAARTAFDDPAATRIGSHAAFFTVIDRECATVGDVTQARLLDLHGAEGLRRAYRPVKFIASRLALAWDANAVGASSEHRQVAAILAAARKWHEPARSGHSCIRRYLRKAVTRCLAAIVTFWLPW